jgi:diguanylate cyclase (GGDEF)-like protein
MAQESSFTPLVLLIEDQEWTARSLESILNPAGYAVFKAYTGRQGLDILHKMIPDIVLVSLRLPDMTGLDVLRRLRQIPTVFPSTPRVILTSGAMSHAEKMEVLEAGAWDILAPPYDSQDLTHRMDNWARAKRDADQARDNGLVDPLTGLYNFNGLLRRIEEIVSDASRNERYISFVMVGPASSHAILPIDEDAPRGAVARHLGRALASTLRLSDAVGRVGETEFVIIAPGTDEEGADILARRILSVLERDEGGELVPLRAGVYSVRRSQLEPVSSIDLLSRATAALRRAQADSEGGNGTRTFQLN